VPAQLVVVAVAGPGRFERRVVQRASTYAGSASVTPGSSSPIDAVVVDWCAPPSGASVTPDGVPAITNRDPE
jgi:hypothetical protein